MMQASTMIAPSRHGGIALDKALADALARLSRKSGKRNRGNGGVKVELENLPYTDIIIMNDSTVMNRPPINVTAHSGILSKKEAAVLNSGHDFRQQYRLLCRLSLRRS